MSSAYRNQVLQSMNKLLIAFVVAVAILLPNPDARASSSGIVGRSVLTQPGCGNSSCHGTVSAEVQVSVPGTVNGKLYVLPGATVNLMLRISAIGMKAAGCDISVKTEVNGKTNAGKLIAPQGSGLWTMKGELTHTSSKKATNGEVEFNFQWTAPTEEGTCYIHAAANAVNMDGSTKGDTWAFLEPVEVQVNAANSVAETVSPLTSISPLPAHDRVTVAAPAEPGSTVDVVILNALGECVARHTETVSRAQYVFTWDCSTTSGQPAPPGEYIVAILNKRNLYSGKMIVVR